MLVLDLLEAHLDCHILTFVTNFVSPDSHTVIGRKASLRCGRHELIMLELELDRHLEVQEGQVKQMLGIELLRVMVEQEEVDRTEAEREQRLLELMREYGLGGRFPGE
jgi:hypothetical protein